MQTCRPVPQGSSLRDLRGDLAAARDEQIRQVVALVDGMAERGETETLIAPLRSRLSQLRPSRPLRFGRLLFTPLDPMIVAPADWQPGAVCIPRSAIAPIASMVRAALGPAGQTVEDLIGGARSDDEAVTDRAGAILWPAAAKVLAATGAPRSWAESGLPAAAYGEITESTRVILGRAGAIRAFARARRAAQDEATVKAIVAGGPVLTAHTAGILGALLLAIARDPAPVLAVLSGLGPGRSVPDAVIGGVLEAVRRRCAPGGSIAAGPLAATAADIRREAAILEGLAKSASTPERRRQAETRKREMDAACRRRFTAGLDDELLAPIEALRRGEDVNPSTLEAIARDLRRLDIAARRLGGCDSFYDTALRQAATAIGAGPRSGGFGLADQVRLVEIVAGPDEALKLLCSG